MLDSVVLRAANSLAAFRTIEEEVEPAAAAAELFSFPDNWRGRVCLAAGPRGGAARGLGREHSPTAEAAAGARGGPLRPAGLLKERNDMPRVCPNLLSAHVFAAGRSCQVTREAPRACGESGRGHHGRWAAGSRKRDDVDAAHQRTCGVLALSGRGPRYRGGGDDYAYEAKVEERRGSAALQPSTFYLLKMAFFCELDPHAMSAGSGTGGTLLLLRLRWTFSGLAYSGAVILPVVVAEVCGVHGLVETCRFPTSQHSRLAQSWRYASEHQCCLHAVGFPLLVKHDGLAQHLQAASLPGPSGRGPAFFTTPCKRASTCVS
ncbi:hypothetical protein ABL78_4055 [Leptomonas seymouri]|uniref:Uncharacterized protein n=1 Tax=Leptomonas seymouri TaxID=5684 RepID=A0A0N1HX45_LEPSE|nr:hypothetical protein ABL78_4055 [Leptomonas seymouri]|eukprot:KPI86865.1 hypothetical protein ABL78_4055 [Leptomonas seymouri]